MRISPQQNPFTKIQSVRTRTGKVTTLLSASPFINCPISLLLGQPLPPLCFQISAALCVFLLKLLGLRGGGDARVLCVNQSLPCLQHSQTLARGRFSGVAVSPRLGLGHGQLPLHLFAFPRRLPLSGGRTFLLTATLLLALPRLLLSFGFRRGSPV